MTTTHPSANDSGLNLDRLETLARAATPGRWMRLFGERTVYDRMEDGCRGNAIVRADLGYGLRDVNNLDFIAAASPAAVLELIALARRAALANQPVPLTPFASATIKNAKLRVALKRIIERPAQAVELAQEALSNQPAPTVPADAMSQFAAWKGYELPALNGDGHFDKDWLHREWRAFQAGMARAAHQPAQEQAEKYQVLSGDSGEWYDVHKDQYDRANPKYRRAISAQQEPVAAPQQAAAPKPAHGHRDDYYLLANGRRLGLEPISRVRNMPNWVLAMELFATGSGSAYQICRDAGVDPEGTTIQRAAQLDGGQEGSAT
jgi:hypothetical protein